MPLRYRPQGTPGTRDQGDGHGLKRTKYCTRENLLFIQ